MYMGKRPVVLLPNESQTITSESALVLAKYMYTDKELDLFCIALKGSKAEQIRLLLLCTQICKKRYKVLYKYSEHLYKSTFYQPLYLNKTSIHM